MLVFCWEGPMKAKVPRACGNHNADLGWEIWNTTIEISSHWKNGYFVGHNLWQFTPLSFLPKTFPDSICKTSRDFPPGVATVAPMHFFFIICIRPMSPQTHYCLWCVSLLKLNYFWFYRQAWFMIVSFCYVQYMEKWYRILLLASGIFHTGKGLIHWIAIPIPYQSEGF